MTLVTNLGFPRIGAQRELKRTLESYWRDELSANELQATAADLRKTHWLQQQKAGADVVPVNDFSFYDQVLDMAFLLDAIPDRYRALADEDPLAGYFAMARGIQKEDLDLRALEMTKWFDTNYHYIVPELHANQIFRLRGNKPVAEFLEARTLQLTARPVIIGPVSFLLLSKTVNGSDRLALLDSLLPVYRDLLAQLARAGAKWVQIDEPFLVTELEDGAEEAFRKAYHYLTDADRPQLLLTTYFGGLGENLPLVAELPVDGLHVDLIRAKDQLEEVLTQWPTDKVLSLGLIDGRNIWRSDLDVAVEQVRQAHANHPPNRVWIAPSCSLLHVPFDVSFEDQIESRIVSWLSFARQKIEELRVVADVIDNQNGATEKLAKARKVLRNRKNSVLVNRPHVVSRVEALQESDARRESPYAVRRPLQDDALNLPLFPTTTIGSFPQTQEVRQARAQFRSGKQTEAEYDAFLEKETERAVRFQEEIDIDVLVHGEFERNDMVEYFGEQLEGFVFTRNGWVQSYGSRCVKPPIIFGDVERPHPMTVKWSAYAQSLTSKPMKAMLTGPVTILQWSFVRDDQPRSATCLQIALALRDEVKDLENAGLRVIQIDEPAIREGLPLRRSEWKNYLDWAVNAFRISSSGVADTTQIHTHMCYSEFNDIIEAVANLGADVISIETSRSRMELLDAFVRFQYPNSIGPGVYDIHSPRVPDYAEMLELLQKALNVLKPEQLWVNPDCGLKTRGWPETRAALTHMVAAAKTLRERS